MSRSSLVKTLVYLAILFSIPAAFADHVDDLLAPFLQKRFSGERYDAVFQVARALQTLQEGQDLDKDPRVFSTLRGFLERKDLDGGMIQAVLQYFANLKTEEASREILNFIQVIEPKLSE